MLLPVAAALLISQLAFGDTLLEVYQKALQNDPQLREAEATRLAVQQGKPIARGALLPQISLTANYTELRPEDGSTRTFAQVDQTSPTQDINTFTNTSDNAEATNKNWTLQLRQTIFRWDDWVRLSQAAKQASQAEADFRTAQQSLVVRVASAYFDVLAAEDNLDATQAAKDAFGRQFEQARKRFDVGLIAITDVQESQAAYDQAVATEISAKRSLANSREALRAIIDDAPRQLAKPAGDIPLASPDPQDEDRWVDQAMQLNPSRISSQIGAEIATDDVRIARAGHFPSLDLVAQRSDTDNSRKEFTTVSRAGVPGPRQGPFPSGTESTDDSISLQLNVPIFSGGQTTARTRQAVYRYRAARERLERTARETERQTRDAYFGVISEIARVQALKRALESTQTALKATEAGYEVGTRTSVDVLDATRAVYQAQANYLRSRYDYLLNGLKLKQATGTLADDDVTRVSGLLQ